MGSYGKALSVFIGTLILTTGWIVPSVHPAELKIASVDIQRAINECRAGQEAKKNLLKEVEKFQRQAADKQKELQGMKEALEKQAAMLTQQARVAKEKDYQAKLRDFQRWGQDGQNEINQKRVELERNIARGILKIVQQLGADEGFTVILEKNEQIVLYTSKTIDITDRIIKTYDAQGPKK
jgi:outer membrane protein